MIKLILTALSWVEHALTKEIEKLAAKEAELNKRAAEAQAAAANHLSNAEGHADAAKELGNLRAKVAALLD